MEDSHPFGLDFGFVFQIIRLTEQLNIFVQLHSVSSGL